MRFIELLPFFREYQNIGEFLTVIEIFYTRL